MCVAITVLLIFCLYPCVMWQNRLKSDCILAVQLLHARPSDFISYKLNEVIMQIFHCLFHFSELLTCYFNFNCEQSSCLLPW